MISFAQIARVILSYRLTWAVIAILAVLELAFLAMFGTGVLITVVALVIGLALVALWPVLLVTTKTLPRLVERKYRAAEEADSERLLEDTQAAFRAPAEECRALAEEIRLEFTDTDFLSEMDAMLANIRELAENHAQLNSRARRFGTAEQKRAMNAHLKDQVRSVQSSLTALKRFSGNLALIDVHSADKTEIGDELKLINRGLQDAIKELSNDG